MLELVDDRQVTLRRSDKPDAHFDFPPPEGDLHVPALAPWLTKVADALREGRQIAPDFNDGVAVAQALDKLRASFAASSDTP